MLCENCNTQMILKEFVSKGISYCPKCYLYSFLDICIHEETPIKFEISNNKIQINICCKKCKKKLSTAKKFSSYSINEINKMPLVSNEKYNLFINDFYKSERDNINKFLYEIKDKRQVEWWTGYTEYMNSPEWKKKRDEIMIRDNYTCNICGNPAQQVHHLSYVHKPDEYTWELVSLCKDCHFKHYHPERILKQPL
jgi:hypothetical protein